MRTLATFLVQLAMAAEHGPRTHTRHAAVTLPTVRYSRLSDGTYYEETIR